MRYFGKITVFVLATISLFSCACKKEMATNTSENIEQIYFQKWIGGQEISGSGTDLHLKFKQPLATDVYVAKVYFQNQEAFFDIENEQENRTTFVARFYAKPINNDLIMDRDSLKEYGNKSPEIKRENPKFPFDLKPDEAILEFHIKNKITQTKVTGIKEKEAIAYPSTRPKN